MAQKTSYILPKWLIFSKYGHTGRRSDLDWLTMREREEIVCLWFMFMSLGRFETTLQVISVSESEREREILL